MTEEYQFENPNSHYLSNLSNLNLTNNNVQLGRLPTLGEILSNKTKAPINLYNFYLYMRLVEDNVDLLDFWFDLINHLNLCKHYVKGLRESIIRQSTSSSQFATNNPFNGDIPDAFHLNEKGNHKSLSLSMLLELIINDHILEDNDSNRLSEFLRGDINLNTVDPKLKELIDSYGSEDLTQHEFIVDNTSFYQNLEKRISSNSKLLDDHSFLSPRLSGGPRVHRDSVGNNKASNLRHSSLNPSLIEKLIKEHRDSSHLISRQNLKESSHNLLLKYFVEDSEKLLNISPKLREQVVQAIELDGRDDPDVFSNVKSVVFGKLENEHLPNFLDFIAIKNLNKSVTARIIIGFIFIFISFWIAFVLIFLDQTKGIRCVVIITYFIGFYCLISSVYMTDPFLALIRRSESFIPNQMFIMVQDSFVHKLLLKRSAWVMLLVLLATAVFSVIMCLVPGRRL